MKRHDSGMVWMTGSRKTINRVIYSQGGRYYVKWYGNFIEVRRGTNGYISVEMY